MRLTSIVVFAIASLFWFSSSTRAQAQILITGTVDDSQVVTLAGTTRPEANVQNDRGPVSDTLWMPHLWLQLRRSPQQQAALEAYLAALEQPGSANYHQWLSAAQFGSTYGLSDGDLPTIVGWLRGHNFTVNSVLPSGMLIDFSGTAGDIRNAFHTEIHNLNVNGQAHIANISDQQIPAALAQAVAGVVSLSDIRPHSLVTNVRPISQSEFTAGGPFHYVAPGDLATIYNLNPLFAAGLSGTGQTIVVLEDSDVYDPGEWSQYRRFFGLGRPYVNGSFAQIHPALPGSPCIDPGPADDAVEATIDAQWAAAAAPNANVVLASCDNTYNFGVFTALVNLLNGTGAPPAIMSISYGGAEAQQGSSANAFINSVYQQAVAEGVSLFVSSGDSGADNNTRDREKDVATTGISVNALASTSYNVAVGGTDFAETYLGQTARYWGANSPRLASALSYIPEIPWNNSCASLLIALFYGYSTTFGPNGFCNSSFAANNGYQNIIAGSGGPSAIYTKPSWQAIYGNPSDGVRDLPDVSLFAAVSLPGSNGSTIPPQTWGHSYVFCFNGPVGPPPPTAYPCSQGYLFTGGGTSFASPIMAGIQALVNQSTGARWGNPAPIYYSLAKLQYGATGNPACNASLGNAVAANCIYHDITLGDMDIVCSPGTPNCYSDSGGAYGVLSTSVTSYQPAYPATPGWDFATGIGSVNAYNLVQMWFAGVNALTNQNSSDLHSAE